MKAFAVLVVVSATAAASPPPKGFAVVPTSASPDGKLAVIAPDTQAPPTKDSHEDKLIEVATGKVVATLVSPTAAIHDSEVDFEPRWSADGSLLEWYVDGKWGSYALVLVRVEHGVVTSQIDVRELAVHEVLAEVQRAHPAAAAAAKREGAQAGWWFRDGLAIDVKPAGISETNDGRTIPRPAKLPLAFDVTYTSNPKGVDTFPAAAAVDGTLALVIDVHGKLARR